MHIGLHGKNHQALLEGLDDAQREAVLSEERVILVVAPPGSGKTRVLSERFARLVSAGVDPSGILAVTFTNRAAGEMTERIERLTGLDSRSLAIGTFHSISLRFLKVSRPGFSLLSRADALRVLKDLGAKNPQRAADSISRIKNLTDKAAEAVKGAGGLERILPLYEKRLREENALDLDDLVMEAARAMEEEPLTRVFFDPLTHVMVDEFQDINPQQMRLIKLLVKGTGRSLFAIGDADQAIYSFRGASPAGFRSFANDFPGSTVIRLGTNYRSKERIVSASQALISRNGSRAAVRAGSVREGGEIFLVNTHDERSEAAFIVKEIEGMMGGLTSLTVKGGGRTAARFSDFAVLYRTNRQAQILSDAFARSSVPYHVVAQPGLESGAFLRHLKYAEPGDGITLEGFIKEEGGKAGAGKDLIEAFALRAAAYSGMEAKDTLADFIEGMLLSEPPDNLDVKADKVGLMTMHSSKGLEYPVVFIAGFEDGLIPLVSGDGKTDMEEERRLFYVAMTRAKDRLYLLGASSRQVHGAVSEAKVSRFLEEIPKTLVVTISIEKKRALRRPAQRGLFE